MTVRVVLLVLFSVVLSASGLHADELRISVERMAKTTSAWSPSISPDGSTVAFVSDLSGTPQVWLVPSRGGYPTRITDLADTVSSVSWSPDGVTLAVSAAPGGGMNSQIYLLSPTGENLRRITAGGLETNFGGTWDRPGGRYFFSSNIASGASMPPYEYDLASGDTRLAGVDQGLNRVMDVHPDGRSMLVGRLAGRGDNNVYLVCLQSGEELLLTEHEGPGSFFARFGSAGEVIYFGHNKDRDTVAFGRLAETGVDTLTGREDAELSDFQVIPGSNKVALIWNTAGRSELSLYDVASGESTPIAIPASVLGSMSVSADGKLLALSGRGATDSTNVFVVDTQDLTVQQITQSSRPGVNPDTLVAPELVTFSAHDGLKLSGWLYRPVDGEQPGAYVISFHGGPEGQERPVFRSVYQALLANGIGVFAPNIRGSSGFGKTFVNLDNRELRFDANRDIRSAAQFLISEGIADADRIGIMGGSYGGYAVMVGVTEYPALFAAGVNLFGVVNFETFFANTEPWMAAISGTEYGDPQTQRDLLKALSPIHKIDRVQTPLLVLHGANDTNVPVVEAEQVVEELERRNVPVKYVLFEDEGHGFRKEVNRVTSDVETVSWFIEYLFAE